MDAMTNPAQTNPSPPSRERWRDPRIMATAMIAILLAVIAAVTVLAIEAIHFATRLAEAPARIAEAPGKFIEGLAGAFGPTVTVDTLFSSAIGQIHSHPKLVVMTAPIDAEVSKASNTTWAGINFGTTTVRIRAHDNKVQYYVPLQNLATSNFVYDDIHKKLVVRVPAPVLDREIVDVQSDPAKIDIETSNGWAKLDTFSGAPLREEAQHDLRNAVLIAGSNELLEHEAERRGQEVLRNALRPIADALKPDVELDIEFFPQP
jgi:hypothetical protein